MTREITRADIEFLVALQGELVTQDTCCQAEPRYWVVRDEHWESCWEGEADRFALVEDGERIGELCEYRDDLPDGLCCVPERKVSRNVPDTLFVTLREAQEHIGRNRHNLGGNPHPYAMTAMRSPQVERLWKLLQEVDWGRLMDVVA